MKRKLLFPALAFAAALGFSGAATALLFDRGNGLIYDDVLDITWLQNANLFKTQYDADNTVVNQIITAVPTITHTGTLSPYSIMANDFNTTTGRMTWFGAMAWAEWLNFGGYDDWRLASMSVSGGVPTGSASSVVNCSSSTTTQSACQDNELGYQDFRSGRLVGGNMRIS